MKKFVFLVVFCTCCALLDSAPTYADLPPEKGIEADLSGLIYAATCMEKAGYKFDPAFQNKFFKDEIVKFSESQASEIIKNAQEAATNLLDSNGLNLCPIILKNLAERAKKAGLDSSAIEYALEKFK